MRNSPQAGFFRAPYPDPGFGLRVGSHKTACRWLFYVRNTPNMATDPALADIGLERLNRSIGPLPQKVQKGFYGFTDSLAGKYPRTALFRPSTAPLIPDCFGRAARM